MFLVVSNHDAGVSGEEILVKMRGDAMAAVVPALGRWDGLGEGGVGYRSVLVLGAML